MVFSACNQSKQWYRRILWQVLLCNTCSLTMRKLGLSKTCFVSSTDDELKETRLTEQRHTGANCDSTIHISNVSNLVELRTEGCPAPMQPSLPPPSVPITVIPIPVVTPNPTGSPTLPVNTLSPPVAPSLASPRRDPHSPQEQSAAALPCSPRPKPDYPPSVMGTNHRQHIQNHHHSQLISQTNNTQLQQQSHSQLLQRYPGSIVSPQQQHALLPHSGHALPQAPVQNGLFSQSSPTDDGRQLDKKRPGG